MTGKQKFIQLIYPIIQGIGKVFGTNSKVLVSAEKAKTSFCDLKAITNS